MKRLIIALTTLLLLASCGDRTAPVNYKIWYNWPERFLPDFSTLGEPDIQGVKRNIDLMDIVDTMNHYAALFETTLKVPATEEYTFNITTDDGSRFYIDGELLIENDGAHRPIQKFCTKTLEKGRHELRLEFFDYDKLQTLEFLYSTPTIPERRFNDRIEQEQDRLTSRKGFVKPQVKEAWKRFAAWKGDDEVLVFPILTDIHSNNNYQYKHIGYAAVAGKMFGADFMALLGDIGLNSIPTTLDKGEARKMIDNTLEQMHKWKGMWIFAPGNHDWDGGEGEWLTEEYLTDTFQRPWEPRAGGNLHLTGKTYGWYDIPGKGFRIVFLNSCCTRTLGGTYYLVDEEEENWLKETLDATPEGMHVIVLAHFMPDPMGRWQTNMNLNYLKENNARVMKVLSDYAAKGILVGMLTGDSHVNDYDCTDGVNYYISQGYGWNGPEMLLPTNKHAYFDYRQCLCIDVVAVKPAKREVHTFRIGAGGEEYDYSWEY